MPLRARAAGFEAWLGQFRGRARAAGISARTLDAALAGVRQLPKVIANDRRQAEVARPLQDYIGTAASSARIGGGQRALQRFRTVLGRIERQYRVPKEVIVAIWGMESSFGGFRGSSPVISTLATLAHEGRRRDLFEAELIAALRILQAGDITPARMQGSFAGAMGHTQFIPTSYLAYAQDFDGDGRRDIWSDDPTDALASTAAYLKRSGWTKGQPWGVEVVLPRGFDYRQTGERIKKSPSEWAALGVRDMRGGRVADHGRASILLPAGAQGAAFMIFDNFHVIERYNPADAYVIAVGHLSDRIAGGPDFRGSWPRGDRALMEKMTAEILAWIVD